MSTAAATWALFLGIGLLMLGNGLQGSVVGIRSQSEGFSTVSTGLVMAAYFAGFLGGTRAVTKALAAVGHIRVFAALASMTSTAFVVYTLAVIPAAWMAMRFVTGFCIAGLYVVAESWLNDLATNRTRGRHDRRGLRGGIDHGLPRLGWRLCIDVPARRGELSALFADGRLHQ